MKEKRDPDITEDIINHIRAIIDRDDKAQAEFIANYPDKYPEPRRKQEWQAYKELKKVWTDNEIDAFISAYDTDDMIYPGILDQPGKPSLTEFLHDVGLLAEGRYALTLPTSEMLSLLAGEYASKQHESSKVGASKTNQRFLDAKQTAIKTARELWAADSEKEYLKRDMIGYCFQDLRAKGLYIPSEEKLWEWLKLEPGLLPDYASQPGRPAKS